MPGVSEGDAGIIGQIGLLNVSLHLQSKLPCLISGKDRSNSMVDSRHNEVVRQISCQIEVVVEAS